jgi:Fe-S cluster assembly ATPase SufC
MTTTSPLNTNPDALVELRDIRFGYGERVILDGITLTVPRGKVTALMGASGAGAGWACLNFGAVSCSTCPSHDAGKTTLLDVIAGRKNSGKMEGEIFLVSGVAGWIGRSAES